MDPDLFYLLGLGVLGIAAAAGVIALERRPRPLLARISAATGGSDRAAKGSATLGGIHFDYELVGQGKGEPPGMLVSVQVASGAKFQMRKRDIHSKVFHAIGLSEVSGASTEVLTGDAEFDGAYLLVCDSAATGQQLFSLPQNRKAAQRILERGYYVLKHDGQYVAARINVMSEAFAPRIVTEIVPILAELAASIRQNARPPLAPDPLRWHCRVALAISALFVIAAFAAFYVRREYPLVGQWDFALASLAFSLPVAALVALLALWLARGARLLGYLAGVLLSLPLLGWWGGTCLNGALDRGAGTVLVAPVVGKYFTEGYPQDFFVALAPWRSGGGEVMVRGQRLYGVVQAGRSLVRVTTKPGYFGHEWIESTDNAGFAK